MRDFVSGLPVSSARSVLSLVRWRAHKYVCHANDHPSCVFSLKWCVWSQQEAAAVCPNQVARVRRSYKWTHLILDARARSKRLIGKGLHLPNWASVSGCVGQVSVNTMRWKANFYFDIKWHGVQSFCDQCLVSHETAVDRITEKKLSKLNVIYRWLIIHSCDSNIVESVVWLAVEQ